MMINPLRHRRWAVAVSRRTAGATARVATTTTVDTTIIYYYYNS